jgi:hypothetical protein
MEVSEGTDNEASKGSSFSLEAFIVALDSDATQSQKLTSDNCWVTKIFNQAMLIYQRTKKDGGLI